MKSGTNDPFDEGEEDTADDGHQYPYKLRRETVKDERTMVQFYLQRPTERRSSSRKAEFEEEYDVDVYTTDWREAAFLAGLNDVEIVEVLREWGYEV